MATLDGPRRPPKSGAAPSSVVVLLHGRGADGDDLIGIADAVGDVFPGTAFHSPHAPIRLPGYGYQWFALGRSRGPRAGHAGRGTAGQRVRRRTPRRVRAGGFAVRADGVLPGRHHVGPHGAPARRPAGRSRRAERGDVHGRFVAQRDCEPSAVYDGARLGGPSARRERKQRRRPSASRRWACRCPSISSRASATASTSGDWGYPCSL